jgi:hypothetical protein
LEEDTFDLLSSQIDLLTLSKSEKRHSKEDEEDFELIPLPDCFNLDIPFEIIQKDSLEENNNIGGGEELVLEESITNNETNNDTEVEEDWSKSDDDDDDDEEFVHTNESDEKQPENLDESYHSVQMTQSTDNEGALEDESIQVIRASASDGMDALVDVCVGVANNIRDLLRPSPTKSLVMYTQPMDRLVEMGFANREDNQRLLDIHNNDLSKVISELLIENDGTWAQRRH